MATCAELFDASVKKTPFVGRPYPLRIHLPLRSICRHLIDDNPRYSGHKWASGRSGTINGLVAINSRVVDKPEVGGNDRMLASAHLAVRVDSKRADCQPSSARTLLGGSSRVKVED